MCGRKVGKEIMSRKEFIKMYVSGMNFVDIGERIGLNEMQIKKFFLQNFLGFERLKLKKKHIKNLNRGDV